MLAFTISSVVIEPLEYVLLGLSPLIPTPDKGLYIIFYRWKQSYVLSIVETKNWQYSCSRYVLTSGSFSADVALLVLLFVLILLFFRQFLLTLFPSICELGQCQFCFLLPHFQPKNWLPCLF